MTTMHVYTVYYFEYNWLANFAHGGASVLTCTDLLLP